MAQRQRADVVNAVGTSFADEQFEAVKVWEPEGVDVVAAGRLEISLRHNVCVLRNSQNSLRFIVDLVANLKKSKCRWYIFTESLGSQNDDAP